MTVPQLIAAELRRLVATRMGRLALLALGLVPLLYGGVYLWANQDPYARLDELPVALVVDDAGDDGRIVGDEVADRLVADAAFDWHRVSAEEAAAGVADATYDFSVTLPASFSADLASAAGDDPHRAVVELSTNDANSYLATTIGTQAAERIRTAVARSVGEEAASRMLLAISDIRDGLVDAHHGASTLADGADDAASGAGRLASGADELADGTAQLSTGAGALADGTGRLADGAARLDDGLGQLERATASLPAQTRQLADGAQQVADGDARIAAIGGEVADAVAPVAARVPEARAAIAERLQQAGLDDEQIAAALGPLDGLGDDVAAADARVQDASAQLDRLASGAQQVADGAERLAGASPQLAAGISSAADGAGDLASGAAAAHDGAVRLADGAVSAASGAGELATGVHALDDGLRQLDDGTAQLRDGLGDAVEQIPATTEPERAAQASTISDPVRTDADAVASAGSYGAGLAPFFLSLAAWIGMYALMLILKPLSRRAITALRSPVRVSLAAWLIPALIGAVQMAALLAIVGLALGFPIAHPAPMLGMMVLAVAAFAAIIVALNAWLGSVGQFLGLVLMVVQLVTAGGTFPWQTLPAPLAALHHALPMSYAVDGLRQLMYGGSMAAAGTDALVLAAFGAAALALIVLGVARMVDHRTLRDLQPSLIG